jgi:Short C-terminal domain
MGRVTGSSGPTTQQKQAPVSPKAPPDAPTSAAPEDPFAQIERLGELRDTGLLSDEEFEAKKAEVLGRM